MLDCLKSAAVVFLHIVDSKQNSRGSVHRSHTGNVKSKCRCRCDCVIVFVNTSKKKKNSL